MLFKNILGALISLTIYTNVLLAADNSTNQGLNQNDKTIDKNSIKIRFYNQLPSMIRIKCDNICQSECREKIKLESIRSMWSFNSPDSKTIGMTMTKQSEQILREGGGFWKQYFAEYQIDEGSGKFQLFYDFSLGGNTSTLHYSVVLESGKEYEIHAYQNGSGVYSINGDGTTNTVPTQYPEECSLSDMLFGKDKKDLK